MKRPKGYSKRLSIKELKERGWLKVNKAVSIKKIEDGLNECGKFFYRDNNEKLVT